MMLAGWRISLSAGVRRLVVGTAALSVAACAGSFDRLGDSRPNAAVARAHSLPVHGVDVSRYQSLIDWASVAASGKRFAYIKATEGGDYVDPRFLENWVGAQRAGLKRGAYHFMTWCRPASEQAAWFKQSVPADPNALPPVLDLEWNHASRCPQTVSKEKALAMVQVMLREMEAHTGKRPLIYTDINFHKAVLEGELPNYPHWIRSTAAEPAARYKDRTWTLWQYTTTGRVPGISGDVDRNAFYGTEAEWAAFVNYGCDARISCGQG